jgi:hypothetical protein
LLRGFSYCRTDNISGCEEFRVHKYAAYGWNQNFRKWFSLQWLKDHLEDHLMGRYLLLWLLGVPLPILFLIWIVGGLH